MVSGSSAAANADTLIFNMMSAFYTGCATFVSRNWGAGKTDRILKSYRIVLLYSFLVGSICGGLLLLFGDKFLGLFANEADVIAAGMQRLKIMGFSFGVSALMDASIAASRGIGRSIIPTIIVIMGSCVFRVIWVYTVFAYFGTIPPCSCCTSSPGPSRALPSGPTSGTATRNTSCTDKYGKRTPRPVD